MASERALTAHHEAGHALVGFVWWGNPGRVSIRPEGRALGVQVTERFAWSPEAVAAGLGTALEAYWLARAHTGVRHALAGRAAESLLTGRGRPWVADSDGEVAAAYVAAAYPGGGTVSLAVVVDLEWRRVRRWLREHWRHVRRVARRLEHDEEITGDELVATLAGLPLVRRPLYAEDRAAMAGLRDGGWSPGRARPEK